MADQEEDQGITAYHGSPHEFEQFDLSKIGTGEGAQAYGHGLYFAESEPIAQSYRDNLLGRGTIMGGGADDLPNRWQMAVYEAMKKPAGEIREYAINTLRSKAPPEYSEQINKLLSNKGHMYEVSINAHPDHFLDWDKPLSEQSEHVQNALQVIADKDEKKFGYGGGSHYYLIDPDSYSGEDLYKYLRSQNEQQNASEILHNHGIKGIKYLDAGSRGKEDGTRNYVVFDDKLVNVKRRYARGGAIDHNELEKAADAGQNGDTMLAHINPIEAEFLKRLGGSGTINPKTGLPQFDNPSMGDYGGSWGGGGGGASPGLSGFGGGSSSPSGVSGGGFSSPSSGGGGGGYSSVGGGDWSSRSGGRDSSPSIDRSIVIQDKSPGLGFGGAEIMSPLGGISNGVPMFAPPRSQDQMLRALGIEGEVDKSGLPTPFRLGADIGTQYAREAVTPDFNVPNAQDLYAASNLPLVAELEAQKERDRIAAQNLAFNVGPSGKIIDRPDMRTPEQIDSTRRAINWGSTIGQGIANLGSMMSAQPEGITDPSIVARQNMPRNFDAPVTDYGAPNAPLAVNQNMGASNQERSQGPALEDIMGTRPQGEYLFSGMDISQKPIPRTYLVNPDEIAAQVRAKEPLAAFVGNDYILNEMRKQMPPDIQYENGRVSGFDVRDPETLANLEKYGISASSFKPVMQTSATTNWGSPSAGPYRSVVESGAEPQTFGSMYPLSPSTQQEQPSAQPASTEPRIGMPQLSRQPIQTSSAQQPMTVRENFDKAFADARAQGKTTFQWTDPKTGILGTYTTQLARKAGGRVPSLKEPEQWIAKIGDVSSVAKARKPRKTSKIQGTAIVQRALMLSSRKS